MKIPKSLTVAVALITFCVVLLTVDMALKNYMLYQLATEVNRIEAEAAAEAKWARRLNGIR